MPSAFNYRGFSIVRYNWVDYIEYEIQESGKCFRSRYDLEDYIDSLLGGIQ